MTASGASDFRMRTLVEGARQLMRKGRPSAPAGTQPRRPAALAPARNEPSTGVGDGEYVASDVGLGL